LDSLFPNKIQSHQLDYSSISMQEQKNLEQYGPNSCKAHGRPRKSRNPMCGVHVSGTPLKSRVSPPPSKPSFFSLLRRAVARLRPNPRLRSRVRRSAQSLRPPARSVHLSARQVATFPTSLRLRFVCLLFTCCLARS
jgi:hypothetical protein